MKDPVVKLAVTKQEEGNRLDVFCTHRIEGHSRSYYIKLAAAGHLKIGGREVKASHRVKAGEEVTVEMAAPPPIEAQPEDIPLDIIYEDEHLLVVNKSADMVVHPAAGNYNGTLVNALLHHFSELEKFRERIRPGLVHRLDKNTSGLLVVAKDERTLAELQLALRKRGIDREYMALVWGRMPQKEGIIDLPMGRSASDRKKMAVFGAKDRTAVTYYRVARTYGIGEMLNLKLETGRTHQIRVHLSYFGNPVIGDSTYGGRTRWISKFQGGERQLATSLLEVLSRQALHAYRLSFVHPVTGQAMSFTSELPEDIKRAIALLEAAG